MNIRPMHDLVVIRPDDPHAEVSRGGIHIPQVYQEDQANKNDYVRESNQWCRGVVVAVGPGQRNKKGRREAIDLEHDQVVFYKRAEASDVPDSELIMVHAASIAFEISDEARQS